jgi:hypothetical protein
VDGETLSLITVPIFTGAIGYLTNWSGVWMLFYPVYPVLEAQPDVMEAMSEGGRGRTVRRSIHLTPFGEDFCRAVLPPQASSD